MGHYYQRRPGKKLRATLRASVSTLAVTAAAANTVVATGQVVANAQGAHAATTSAIGSCPWMNTALPASERANLMIAAMTLPEKLMWLNEQNSYAFPTDFPQFCIPNPDLKYTNGATGEEGNGSGVTAYPDSMAVAATFDPMLAEQEGSERAEEAWLKGTNVILAPIVNLVRTPLWGRGYSTFGEDPYLSGVMGAAEINGIQGNPTFPVMAVVKHWDAYNQEYGRLNMNVTVSDSVLHELYQLPFEMAVRDANPGGVMCAFPMVNGQYACQNPSLNDVLKAQDGFTGWVVSDFFADHSTAGPMNAGMDVELNVPRYYSVPNLEAALSSGQITMSQVNEAVYRYLYSIFRLGLWKVQLPSTPADKVSTPQSVATAAQIGAEGTVLLKNELLTATAGTIVPLTGTAETTLPFRGAARTILPLRGTGKTIAVIGPTASGSASNGLSALNACAGNAISFGDQAPRQVIDCSGVVSALQAIQARAAQAGDTVVYNNGSDPASAAELAAKANYAIVFGYYGEGEGSDRSNLSLDANGDALIEAVAAANPETIVVLNTGGPVLMPWLNQVAAVLENWYGGQAMGDVLAGILWGDINPSGKLPVTFPASMSQLPTAGSTAQYPGVTDASGVLQTDYSEGLEIGYRWYLAQGLRPLFPFGYGLSYTRFRERIIGVQTDPAGGVNVRVMVQNTGNITGSQVVELYLQDPAAAGEPSRQLEGFQRVSLRPHQATMVNMHLTPWQFATWDNSAQDWQVVNGLYEVQLGTSASDIVDERGVYLSGCMISASATAAECSPNFNRLIGRGNGWYFDSYNPAAQASEYSAKINWSDGSTSTAGVHSAGVGLFAVDPVPGGGNRSNRVPEPVTITDNIFSDSVQLSYGPTLKRR